MKATPAIIVMSLLLSGCGSCQRTEPSAGGGAGAPKPTGATAGVAGESAGKIQVAPVEPTVFKREGGKPPQPAEGNVPADAGMPPPAAPGAAGQPEAHDEGDCIVIADANPDYGPPPLAVAFSAEAECSSGQSTYSWNFGEGSETSTEANPSHTYAHPGEYTATVTVTGPSGATANDEIDITVEESEGEPES